MATILSGRLHALAAAHALVRPSFSTRESQPLQPAASLSTLILTILKPHEMVGAARFVVEGPDIRLGSQATTSLALVFHELATNAAKYGALLRDEGRVSISWGQEGEALALQWRESGGPVIAAEPVQKGFGSTLARNTIIYQLGGTFTLDWQAQGLVASFLLPLANLAH